MLNRMRKYFQEKRWIRKRYLSYFSFIKKELKKLVKIDENIPEDIVSFYMLHKDEKNKYVFLFRKRKEEMKVHNQKVKAIYDSYEFWNKEEFMKNPRLYSELEISIMYQSSIYLTSFSKKYISSEILNFQKEIKDIFDCKDEIFMQYEWWTIFQKNREKINSIYGYVSYDIYSFMIEEEKDIKEKIGAQKQLFFDFSNFQPLEVVVERKNEDYVEKSMNDEIFKNINGKSLDEDQRKAILTDEHATLVIAGAGSGKTLTICGKVKYLLEMKNVDPREILLLSFSKKSKEDLSSKISSIHSQIPVMTFHKLGLDIIASERGYVPDVEDQLRKIIEDYFKDELPKKKDEMERILHYYGLFLREEETHKYQSRGEQYQKLKYADYTTLQDILRQSKSSSTRLTFKKELVKSVEELEIANWYFLHGVDYTYEASFPFPLASKERRQYRPDFCIEGRIYHEHYGINKDGRCPQYTEEDEKEYLDSMEWKRKQYHNHELSYFETYSYDFSSNEIFEKLEKELTKHNVKMRKLTQEEIKETYDSIYCGKSFQSFIRLVISFLNLYKGKYRDEKGFEILSHKQYGNRFENHRANFFLKIVKDIYKYYQYCLSQNNRIDFDDMIFLAVDAVKNNDAYRYKYIIVDEFQDISESRMQLLKALIEHGNSKLFAVGDDWQAIYRFAGCDLNIFLNFSSYFGFSKILTIRSTHRNSQELQDIIGDFIKKNPYQKKKTIISKKHLQNPIAIFYYENNKEKIFLKILSLIFQEDNNANILVLGRNNYDIDFILKSAGYKVKMDSLSESGKRIVSLNYPSLRIKFSTVHSAKGLEEDYVILVNAEDKIVGFPNKMEDDSVLKMLLSSPENYPYAEERRLWYVALTRTRKYTFILVPTSNPSCFIEEIKDQCYIEEEEKLEEAILCPYCHTGKLIKREANGTAFYGCSNYPYCTYTTPNIEKREKDRSL